jgi:hypothetical protein
MSERISEAQAQSPRGGADPYDEKGGGHSAKLAIAWTIVGVPLGYGVVSVVIRASQLFTG